MTQVIITPQAQKHFVHLPASDQNKIRKKLLALEANPLSGKKLTGELAKLRSLKAWPYRIIYSVSGKQLFITSILHRQGAYKK